MKSTRRAGSGLDVRRLAPRLLLLAGVLLNLACATTKVGPTAILQAAQEIPEDQLLDVGIVVFASEPMDLEKARKQGTSLQQSSQWGAVRVLPAETDSVDLLVTGRILESHGETLAVRIEARDASGRLWLERSYESEAAPADYAALQPGEKDAFQDLYNRIANDLAAERMQLSPPQARELRILSQLRFARRFAPEAYAGYLKKGPGETLVVNRLPAEGDAMMARLLKIREREHLFVDTLNRQYESFYTRMWPSYESWRKSNLEERQAREKIERDALIRTVGGVLLVAGAIAMGASQRGIGPLEIGMIVIGGQVIVNGVNLSKQAEMHSESIRELSETFGSEMKPVLVEFEGKSYELTGPAEEQFRRWRELLREIYRAETGFGE
ncbi:MAG: hypothetical protein MUF46_11765 [Desulfobacterales bacterium]|nr:hypothetical protein [Desulfobacterales bacterium]